MSRSHRHEPRSPRRALRGAAPSPATLDGTSLSLDLLRGDLYRMLDELARARPGRHRDLVREFERAWASYKEVTGRRN